MLAKTGWEIIRARGPLNEAGRAGAGGGRGWIHLRGRRHHAPGAGKGAAEIARAGCKYGIGVDKIDVKTATEFGIPVLFTPGVNHTTVAEHTFMLHELLALEKNLLFHTDSTRSGGWKRKTGA